MKKNNKNIITRIFRDNKYCWLAFGCSAAIMLIVYICYSLIPFGDVTILRMDLYHQYGPLFAELYDRVTEFKSFFYSWNTGLGSSFLGNFYNYLCSPISIVMLIFGHENMPEAIATMILLQAAFSSASFTYYLKKSFGEHSPISAAFGVLYSFCGFFIAYYWNLMWLDAMVLFPLMVLGIEQIINERKPVLYIFSLAMLLLTSYYMGFMACIFAVLYFLVYYFSRYNISDTTRLLAVYTDADGEKYVKLKDKIRYSSFLSDGFTFAFSSIAGAALVAFALIPVYFILQSCSATSGTWPETVKSYFDIFDFIANHLASVTPTIRSSGTDVLPNVYCGIGTVILVPLYLFCKRIPIREKIANILLLGLLYFSFNLNVLNYIWHAFHFPNDLPYRFSFMYSFVLLTLGYKAFKHITEFKGKEILGAGIAVLSGIIIIQKIGSKNVTETTVIVSLLFVVLYTLIFYLFSTKKYQASAMAVLMLCCVCAESISANTDNYSMDRTKSEYAGDYEEFREVKDMLDNIEGNDTYRMELTSLRARMDPAWYNYNGVSTFSSMAYEKLANLQEQLGLFGNYINSYTYNAQTPVYNAMMSLKYIVDNNEYNSPLNSNLYEYVVSSGKFNAFSNKYYLPIAYCVDSNIELWSYDSSNPFDVQNDYFYQATGIENVFTQLEISDSYFYNIDPIVIGLDTGYMNYYKTNSDESGNISFTFTCDKTQNVYLFIESAGIEYVTVSVGYNQYSYNTSREYVYDIGECTAGTPITVEMTVKDSTNSSSLNFFAYGLDMDKFEEGYNKLSSGAMTVESFTDTKISGTVTAVEDCVLYTSIPYDKGWSVMIDGKKVSEDDIIAVGDALLGVRLSEGEHTVEFSFMPRGLVVGIVISVCTLLILIAITVLIRKKKKNAPQPVAVAVSGEQNDVELIESSDIATNDPSNFADESFTDESDEQ